MSAVHPVPTSRLSGAKVGKGADIVEKVGQHFSVEILYTISNGLSCIYSMRLVSLNHYWSKRPEFFRPRLFQQYRVDNGPSLAARPMTP
jgi:hypothetical protein